MQIVGVWSLSHYAHSGVCVAFHSTFSFYIEQKEGMIERLRYP